MFWVLAAVMAPQSVAEPWTDYYISNRAKLQTPRKLQVYCASSALLFCLMMMWEFIQQ